jgi:hypothetical protein
MTGIYKPIYESVQEMTAAADAASKAGRRRQTDEDYRSRGHFWGRKFSGWDDVVQKVAEYWPEGLDLVQGMLHDLRDGVCQSKPKSRVRRARWSADDGDDVDVDRLRSGQDCWRLMAREQRDAPQNVAIVFSLATRWERSAESILWRGAVAIVLADLLEDAGYRVEVWAVNNMTLAYENGATAQQAVCLKHSEVPVDIASLVNGVSGWFYRTVVFQSYYAVTASTPNPCMGYPKGVTEETEVVQDAVGDTMKVVIDEVWDRDAAVSKVREVIAGLNQ